ncbi:rCG20523 [Rattus norvegicus]|uniref:RCG20523 n=1 Tax=Rattus norvegicus TaxID=10116 RepID=A6K5M7_RAT|nr:rCG20523 [Rattus norvegicus]
MFLTVLLRRMDLDVSTVGTNFWSS